MNTEASIHEQKDLLSFYCLYRKFIFYSEVHF